MRIPPKRALPKSKRSICIIKRKILDFSSLDYDFRQLYIAKVFEVFPELKSTPQSLQEKLIAHNQTQRFDRGEVLYHTEEPPKGLYLLKSGLIGLAITSEAGREHLLRLFVPHDFLGHRSMLAEESYHATARALEASEFKFLPREVFFELIDSEPHFARFVMKRLAKDLGDCERRHKLLVENDAQSRIAGAIIYLKDIHPDHVWTRKEIADFSGTTTETVIRSLGRFEQEGLIAQEGRPIHILQRQRLIDKARYD